jgi:iron(III) transport system ATP-binding protein
VSAVGVRAEGIDKRFGDVPVLHGVSVAVEPGAVLALLGPSGCGKTTLLRILAGLERPDAGTVTIGDRDVTTVPPERRRVGMVFQDWALFPHMTVARNVGYGIGRHEADRADRVEAALGMVGLTGLGDRLPGTLSGGQQQRVALARALAPRPAVLLLDEPFSNLDTALRVQVRSEVHALLADLDITSVFVTHDQDEAFVLGDHVAVMAEGRIVQHAEPAELYARPATPWVAGFVGDANLVDGTAAGDKADTALGAVPLAMPAGAGGPVAVQVLVRPESVSIEPAPGAGAVVQQVEYHGRDTLYAVRLPSGASVRARRQGTPVASRGERVAVTYAGPPTVAYPNVG